eukprot:CAMPEP_0118926574 /NCGR_PEP_ID=MMETSP1169-20130426/4230_1 /TAXON_ID=36882 /ORGANISM="Pyramimonas obovata, Strain CCMP722" /LENGTH=436 /DNA_ID=CAMNT_0006868147 /DNA_START=818 /DNA_END=2128 /DNA_ORIENTATION=+
MAMVLVCFAGLMSGLTLGLMSLSAVDLEILARSGNEVEREQVKKVKPLLENEHQLLVTLLLCNAFAMEGLPLCLDQIVEPLTAILISVSVVLVFGEIVPQAVCSKYGLRVGAASAPFVSVLKTVITPIAYPISLVLDNVLGTNHMVPLRRNELKALLELEREQGMLSKDELSVIDGAMDMAEKAVATVATPITKVYSLPDDTVLDMETMMSILEAGFQRVPVYAAGDPDNLTGLLVVKNMIVLSPEDAIPLRALPLLPLQRVPASMPLHSVLTLLRSSGLHTAVVEDEEGRAAGIITLNALLGELLQEKIRDQTNASFDGYSDSTLSTLTSVQAFLDMEREASGNGNGDSQTTDTNRELRQLASRGAAGSSRPAPLRPSISSAIRRVGARISRLRRSGRGAEAGGGLPVEARSPDPLPSFTGNVAIDFLEEFEKQK